MSTESSTPTLSQPLPIPKDGVSGLKQNWVPDLISGFIVFLIALPLSVGIALASGAPPTAGILAAVVGGVIGSLIGGSHLTINGPAAGLIVIVLGAVQDLGQGDLATGFRLMLAATVVAGILQIAMAFMRLGALGVIVPGSVIHGMLTAIGVIIMAKQFHVALGVSPQAKDVLGLIAEIPKSIANLNPEVALIAAIGFIVILGFSKFRGNWAKYVPAPLVAVVVGVYLAHLFDFDHEHLVSSHMLTFKVGPKLLLAIPDHIASAIILPDFSKVLTLSSLRWSITLALVASIESLLSASAVDRLDPYRRVSNLDRELLSKGICNTLCGLVGALPIIAEMVRSTANVRNNARTRWSNFFHGVFVFSFLALFPALLREIPLAALASILVSVGYALANPTQFLHTAAVGKDHLMAFVTTLGVTLASDLLVGVVAGLAVELGFNFLRGTSITKMFRIRAEEEKERDRYTLRIQSPLVFTNFLSLQRRLREVETFEHVTLDLADSQTVDHTVLDHLNRYQNEARLKGRTIEISFSEHHKALSRHPLAARKHVRRAR